MALAVNDTEVDLLHRRRAVERASVADVLHEIWQQWTTTRYKLPHFRCVIDGTQRPPEVITGRIIRRGVQGRSHGTGGVTCTAPESAWNVTYVQVRITDQWGVCGSSSLSVGESSDFKN